MTDLAWKVAKKAILREIGSVLQNWGFQQRNSRFEWFRLVNGIHQIVVAEKMKGGNLRLRVFAVGKDGRPLGGNLTHSSIEGGGRGTVGGDSFWRVSTQEEVEESLISIAATLESIALPWFNTFCDDSRIRAAMAAYCPTLEYDLREFSGPDEVDAATPIDSALEFWGPERVANAISKELGPSLRSKGFEEVVDGFCYVRTRGSVFDVIQIEAVNHGVHFCCYAFNWIQELSPDDSVGYQPNSPIMLVGGILSENDTDRDLPSLYVLGNVSIASNSIQRLSSRLNVEAIPRLEKICNKKEFIESVKLEHRPVLAALGLCSY